MCSGNRLSTGRHKLDPAPPRLLLVKELLCTRELCYDAVCAKEGPSASANLELLLSGVDSVLRSGL